MKLYIPFIGDIITLSKDWSFTPRRFYSASDILKQLGYTSHNYQDGKVTINLPAGTSFRVKQISNKRGQGEYAYASFTIQKTSHYKLKKGKPAFTVRLEVANTMEIDECLTIPIKDKEQCL